MFTEIFAFASSLVFFQMLPFFPSTSHLSRPPARLLGIYLMMCLYFLPHSLFKGLAAYRSSLGINQIQMPLASVPKLQFFQKMAFFLSRKKNRASFLRHMHIALPKVAEDGNTTYM
ncbi:hypothetical protein QBC45DRAFT_418397 [Copromyces sp. CBS 386.78]|nr:hypothetical protein QBC45DRAFT_418397 [Copromyces sp. CBS 386.78]